MFEIVTSLPCYTLWRDVGSEMLAQLRRLERGSFESNAAGLSSIDNTRGIRSDEDPLSSSTRGDSEELSSRVTSASTKVFEVEEFRNYDEWLDYYFKRWPSREGKLSGGVTKLDNKELPDIALGLSHDAPVPPRGGRFCLVNFVTDQGEIPDCSERLAAFRLEE